MEVIWERRIPLSWDLSLDVCPRFLLLSHSSSLDLKCIMKNDGTKRNRHARENALENPIERWFLSAFSSSSIPWPRMANSINNIRIFRASTRQIGAQSMVAWSRLIKTRPCTERLLRRSLFRLIRYHGRCTVTSFIAPTKVPFNRRYSTRTRVSIPAYFPVCKFVFLIAPHYWPNFM